MHTSRTKRILGYAATISGLLMLTVSTQTSADVGPNGEIDGLTARFIDVNGIRTRYYDYGEGEPIVLLHGGIGVGAGSTANNWSRNIRGLAERFRVLAPDRIGQGMTEAPEDTADFGIEGGIKHTYGFIQALGLDRVHLIGHSSGGAMAFYTALEHPEVVKTLGIISVGPGMSRPPGGTKLDAVLEENCPPPPGRAYADCRLLALGHNPETFPPEYEEAEIWMREQPPSQDAQRRVADFRGSLPPNQRGSEFPAYNARAWERGRNGELQMPVLMLSTKQDLLSWGPEEEHAMMTPELNFFDTIGARNPRVKLVLLNEGAHFPYRDQPEQFNHEVMSFIDFWNAQREAGR